MKTLERKIKRLNLRTEERKKKTSKETIKENESRRMLWKAIVSKKKSKDVREKNHQRKNFEIKKKKLFLNGKTRKLNCYTSTRRAKKKKKLSKGNKKITAIKSDVRYSQRTRSLAKLSKSTRLPPPADPPANLVN